MASINTLDYPESKTIAKMLEENKLKEAVGILEKAYDKESRSTKVWNDLGVLYFQSGMIPEATNSFCQALELDPDNKNASENLIAIDQSVKPSSNQFKRTEYHKKNFGRKEILDRWEIVKETIEDPLRFLNMNTIYFHTTNFCNYKCSHCPIAEIDWKDTESKRKYMPFDNFVRYFDSFDRGLSEIENAFGFKYQRDKIIIHPQGGGEPLLHPEFSNIIAHITNNGFPVKLTTNGALLNGKRADALFNADLNELHVSLDAATPETYGKMRQKGQFDKAVSNLEGFISRYKDRKKRPAFVVSFCNTPQNNKDLSQFCEYWASRVDVIWIQKYNDPHESQEENSEAAATNRIFCNRLPGYFMIENNGEMKGCQCGDYIAGNLEKQSFIEILLSKKRIRMFEYQEKGLFNKIDECCYCTKWSDKISTTNPVIVSINNKAYHAQKSNASLHIRNVYGLDITTLSDKTLLP